MRFFLRHTGPEAEAAMLSQTAEYALRTILFIAQRNKEEGPVQTEAIAEALDIPRNYLSKILHRLAQQGVLRSTRGRGGGFLLSRPPEEMPIIDVVGLFDQISPGRSCLLGRPVCSDANACDAHAAWKDLSERVASFFRETTVGDLLGDAAAFRKKRARA
jgi:Rrf2 family protein